MRGGIPRGRLRPHHYRTIRAAQCLERNKRGRYQARSNHAPARPTDRPLGMCPRLRTAPAPAGRPSVAVEVVGGAGPGSFTQVVQGTARRKLRFERGRGLSSFRTEFIPEVRWSTTSIPLRPAQTSGRPLAGVHAGRRGRDHSDLACGAGHLTHDLTAAPGPVRHAGRRGPRFLSPLCGGQLRGSEGRLRLHAGGPHASVQLEEIRAHAFCSDAFHYFLHKPACLGELRRVVAEGGAITVIRSATKHCRQTRAMNCRSRPTLGCLEHNLTCCSARMNSC